MSGHLEDREAIRELLQHNAILLDAERFDEWTGLFDSVGTYELTAYSTEIRRWMTWWLADRPTLEKTLKEVGQHVRDPARRRHIVGGPRIVLDGSSASVVSHFSIYRTTPQGESSLYMVGAYEDRLIRRPAGWLYAARKVITDTRVLSMFTHIPV